MRVVGLTGGIGSGKSSVARMLIELGASVIDADQLAREAVEPGSEGLSAIIERFGTGVLDEKGELDRRKLGAQVFSDVEARRDLNAIVHPKVAALAMARIAELSERGTALAIYDVPLFFENGLDKIIPEVIVVHVSPATQRERIRGRDGLSEKEIEDRIASQLPLADKVKRATFVIENDGSMAHTREQVERLYGRLLAEEDRGGR